MRTAAYTAEEQRVSDYLQEITNGSIGSGEDPVGFLLASHASLRHRIEELSAICGALRDSFPHFQDDSPITAEAIKGIGNEWQEMVVNWVPWRSRITFYDQDGNKRDIVYESGDSDSGIQDGWCIPEDAGWRVVLDDYD